ncbi:MAG: glycosyltransferase involved in cell wall biosynthesis [Myxococcota bacterium]|jgi:glycosyltransferase involved in cell wall biosynthesis
MTASSLQIDTAEQSGLHRQPTNAAADTVVRLSLVFPIFDEERNIEPLLRTALETASRLTPDFEIILVDDGSRDRSAEMASRFCEQDARVRLLQHARNTGYGAALHSGLREAKGELIFFSDADLQFDLSELEGLVEHADEYDIVAGYRAQRSDPWHRRLLAGTWGAIVRSVFSLEVRDIDCAFKLFRRQVIDTIEIESIGAFVNTEILVRASAAGYRIHQVPVTHHARQHGDQSGAKPRVILRALIELATLYRTLYRARRNGVQ